MSKTNFIIYKTICPIDELDELKEYMIFRETADLRRPKYLFQCNKEELTKLCKQLNLELDVANVDEKGGAL